MKATLPKACRESECRRVLVAVEHPFPFVVRIPRFASGSPIFAIASGLGILAAMPKLKSQNQKPNDSGLNFEAQLWAAADKMRGHMDDLANAITNN